MSIYRKTYFCICEGQQEMLYFKHLSNLLRDLPKRSITFNTVKGKPYLVTKNQVEYDTAAVFDFDFNEEEFHKSIALCDKGPSKGKKKKTDPVIWHAYSNVNFDLWLLLHKKCFNKTVFANNDYHAEIRKEYGLGPTENIKNEKVMNKILNQISLADVKKAVERAEQIRSGKCEDGKLCGKTMIYSNPDFSIHLFIKYVLSQWNQME